VGSEPPAALHSESELEQFFDLALDMMVIADFDAGGYFKRVNPAFVRTLGYSSRELLARPFIDFVHPDDVQRARDLFAELTTGGNEAIGFEVRYCCADGTVRWIQWNSLTAPERGVVYGVGRDVTDRRRADAELREAQRMVEASRADLAASRARIVAATDEERRRVVRDLHDGAQQRLVHTVLTLKQARRALGNEETAGTALVAEGLEQAERAMAELGELAHGILPAVLTSGGLRAAVDALASRMPLPVKNSVSVGRLSAVVEATAYFVISEALTNVAKHARATRAVVEAARDNGVLTVEVSDDGAGGASESGGSGLIGLNDRVAALDGKFEVESQPGVGTRVAARLPLAG
jgi:PAS domain S-box-containing protein